MDSILPNSFDIFQIYRQYCDIMSGAHATGGEGCMPDDEFQKVSFSREAVAQLLEVVESKVGTRISILEEAYKLMSRLDLMADFSEFSRFYDFVFFICRENGQKNVTVSRAVMAWRLVLAGRFRLLNQWCNFVERNQRHNISEDTWRQVLAFSRCVHENLEGYDPEGAWPVLIDDFVEHMYRIRGFLDIPKISCNCGVSEPQPSEDSLTGGLKNFPGSKRKSCDNMQMEQESSEGYANSKRRHVLVEKTIIKWGQNQLGCVKDKCSEIGKHNNSSFGCTKSLNTIEGCLSKGFARLLSGHSCLQFDQDRRVSYT